MEEIKVEAKEKSMKQKLKDKEIPYWEYSNYLALKNGCKNPKEYRNYLSIQRGFKDRKSYDNYHNHKAGRTHPQSENKECSNYLGVHIAERILSKIFEGTKRMPQNFPNYDFICKKGYKIEVKSACLYKKKNYWHFNIYKNNIPDFFLLLAFDNRDDLNPIHIWLIKGDEIVGARLGRGILNKKKSLHIHNTDKVLIAYKKYEQFDKLKKIISCCESLK